MASLLATLTGFVASVVALSAVGSLIFLVFSRFFLSPLGQLPGPKLAALTTWYEAYYDVIKPGQYAFKIKQLHKKYGPIIRVSPHEVSIADPDFVDTIYAPGTGHKRDKEPTRSKALGLDGSLGASIPHDLHRRRREALNPFFSPQRISRLEPELAEKGAQLDSIYAEVAKSGEVLNMSDVYFALANDIVYKYCFGNNLDLLSNLDLSHTRRENMAAVLLKVKVMRHFSWIRDLTSLLPSSFGASSTTVPPGVRDMIAIRRDIRAQIDAILARKPSPDETVSIFTHLRDTPDLPPSEKSGKRLEDEAGLLVMAGTYSPMVSLIVMHYHLIARPDVLAKVRAEIGANPGAKTAAQLHQLPYLNGVIQEAHRLSFGLTGRNPRVAPEETLVYTDQSTGRSYALPPGTCLSASTLLIHTDESVFPDPWKFDPDRWLPDSVDAGTLAKRRRCMLGFLRGPRVCIGQHLANQEMATALAAMARWDMELFETVEEDAKYMHDYHVMCPRLGSKGVRVKVTRRH
ncbi:cytochrome P450 [Thozetella sp. PMI_491]|nr:cytochrome P450 [Thozetella sp. PMI_491]